MNKILIFGKNGQVAWELQRSCAVLGEVRSCGSDEVNLESNEQIAEVIRSYKPNFIVNAAAYTAVDRAESEESKAMQINGTAVGVMAEEAKRVGADFVHYSTDYVFDGSKNGPYVESDVTNPLNAYGRSKLLGEQLIQQVSGSSMVLRVSWVYGNRGTNFFKTMIRLGKEKEEIKVVADQIGAPTWCRHIADATASLLKSENFGHKSELYHLTPQGQTNWHEFAQAIFAQDRLKHLFKVRNVGPIPSSEYKTAAVRPRNSMMDSSRIEKQFNLKLPHWRKSLDLVAEDETR